MTTIASGHVDGCVRIWSAKSKDTKPLHEIRLGTRIPIMSVKFSQGQPYLLVGSRDNILRLVDMRNYKVAKTFSSTNFRMGTNWARAVFSQDASHVAACSMDAKVYLWKASDASVAHAIQLEYL